MSALKNLNTELFDSTLRHQIHMQGVTNGTVKKMLALLNRADQDVLRLIRKRGPDGTFSAARLKALLDRLRGMNVDLYSRFRESLRGEMRALAQVEAQFTANQLRHTLPGAITAELTVVQPTMSTVYAAAVAKPLQGKILSDWTKGLEVGRRQAVEQAIRLGVVEGETVQQILNRIRGTRLANYKDGALSIQRRHAVALTRTAVNHVVNVARQTTYLANSDIVKGWQYVATLDASTTDICQALDGQIFPMSKTGSAPPQHYNCRSTTTPVLKMPSEMGIKGLDDLPAGQRASMFGPVARKETYNSWLKRQPKSFQDKVLGPGKAAIFRRGKLPLSKFVDAKNRSLTIPQLLKLEKEALTGKVAKRVVKKVAQIPPATVAPTSYSWAKPGLRKPIQALHTESFSNNRNAAILNPLINRAPAPGRVTQVMSTGGWYSPAPVVKRRYQDATLINIPRYPAAKKGVQRASTRQASVWRHEYGHHLDWEMGKVLGPLPRDLTKKMPSSYALNHEIENVRLAFGNHAYASYRMREQMAADAKRLIDKSESRIMKDGNRSPYNQSKDRIRSGVAEDGVDFYRKELSKYGLDYEETIEEIIQYTRLDLGMPVLGRFPAKEVLEMRAAGKLNDLGRLIPDPAEIRMIAHNKLDDILVGLEVGDGAVVLEALQVSAPGYSTGTMVHDFFGSLTLNKVGNGHTLSYYAKDADLAPTEVFANVIAMLGDKKKLGQKLAETLAPDTWAKSLELISDYMKKTAPGGG